jgi:hypothetical protein
MANVINATSTGNGGLVSTGDDSGILNIQTNETTAITVDASQNVGIGATTPADALNIGTGKKFRATHSASVYQQIFSSSSGNFINAYGDTLQLTADSGAIYLTTTAAQPMVFQTTNADRMRIDSSGNLLVGTTTSDSYCRFSTQGAVGARWGFGPSLTGSDLFRVQNSNTTGVYLTSGNTSWTSNSDERKKDIIEPITNGLQKVSTLRAVIGKYKIDEEGTRRSFLIAQDVQAILPEAVDATDTDNLGVQYTEVIPLLVAAIKELKAINDTQAETINALTARIVALETA